MKRPAIVIIIFLTAFNFSLAQEQTHRWLPLQNKNAMKIWYDAAMIDNAKGGDTFDIWVLEQHNPPLKFKEIEGKVYRSKLLYSINVKSVKYGIMKVVYYNSSNEKIYNFNYPIANFPDKYKYTYPILKDNYLYYIIKEYIKAENKKKKNVNPKR